jgi:hypothetical protein
MKPIRVTMISDWPGVVLLGGPDSAIGWVGGWPYDRFCFSSEMGSDLINVLAHVKWVDPLSQTWASGGCGSTPGTDSSCHCVEKDALGRRKGTVLQRVWCLGG